MHEEFYKGVTMDRERCWRVTPSGKREVVLSTGKATKTFAVRTGCQIGLVNSPACSIRLAAIHGGNAVIQFWADGHGVGQVELDKFDVASFGGEWREFPGPILKLEVRQVDWSKVLFSAEQLE